MLAFFLFKRNLLVKAKVVILICINRGDLLCYYDRTIEKAVQNIS